MKRIIVLVIAVIVVSLLFTAIAFAGATDPQDAHVFTFGPNSGATFGTTTPLEIYSTYNDQTLQCDNNQIAYLKWNLDQVDGEAGTNVSNPTSLVLNLILAFHIDGSDTLDLYKVVDDSWVQSTITGDNAPPVGDLIQSIPAPTSTGLVTFDGAGLASWINENSSYVGGGDSIAGNDIVSFALEINGCTRTTIVRADSMEATTGAVPALNIFDPNSVTLSNFSADNTQPVNYALYAGLAALAVLGLGAAGYGYSRTR